MHEQERQNTTQDIESLLADLEPKSDVKGGFGQPVTFTATISSVSPAITERESGLVYSGESGGLNE